MAEKPKEEKPKDEFTTYSDYGYGTAVVNAIPDLKRLLDQAIKEDWTPQKFQSELQNTKWWKNNQESRRQWEVLSAQTPGEAKRQIQARRAELDRMARAMGVTNTGDLDDLAERTLRGGWSSEEMRSYLAGKFKFSSGQTATGQAAVSVQQLRDLSRAYAVPLSDKALTAWTRRMIEGVADIASFEEEMRAKAKGRFTGIADELDKGFSVEEVFDTYRQTAARILNIDPDQIDLNESKWAKALSFRPEGQAGARAMNLDEWERELRVNKQYGWDKTTEAKNEGYMLAANIRRAFGKSA